MSLDEQFGEIIDRNRKSIFFLPEKLKKFGEDIEEYKKPSKKTNIFNKNYMKTAVVGEKYVADILGTTFDDNIYVGGDGGKDCIWNNKLVSVKSSIYGYPDLLFFLDEPFICDYYVLVKVLKELKVLKDSYNVKIVGWETKENILNKRIIKDGFPPSYSGETKRYIVKGNSLR